MAERPTLDVIAMRLGISVSDPILNTLYLAAIEQQDIACETDEYTDALYEALIRRTANLWSSKSHTLGVLETGDYGVQYMPRYDPVIEMLEAHKRRIVIA